MKLFVPEHRISCHRCGNIRKRRTLCPRPICPHTFCGRCTEKLVVELGENIFEGGCPVCKDLCCCSNKSVTCERKNHCYRKCPATKSVEKRAGKERNPENNCIEVSKEHGDLHTSCKIELKCKSGEAGVTNRSHSSSSGCNTSYSSWMLCDGPSYKRPRVSHISSSSCCAPPAATPFIASLNSCHPLGYLPKFPRLMAHQVPANINLNDCGLSYPDYVAGSANVNKCFVAESGDHHLFPGYMPYHLQQDSRDLMKYYPGLHPSSFHFQKGTLPSSIPQAATEERFFNGNPRSPLAGISILSERLVSFDTARFSDCVNNDRAFDFTNQSNNNSDPVNGAPSKSESGIALLAMVSSYNYALEQAKITSGHGSSL